MSVSPGTLNIFANELNWLGNEIKEPRTPKRPATVAAKQDTALRLRCV